uniref:Uncharacterized protein n=1 Tax=Mimivirus LCMiAC02 TaxID=2506609 RepID=A0A4P6VMM5_9VIRU|nr:MAG: hypothetical protein LCMiAC02_05120 [Mimivirus LCMiAC02]
MDNYNTLILIDFDDSLFVTSWVVKNKIDINNPRYKNKYIRLFKELDELLFKLFTKILKYENTKVVIVTNATRLWVYICLEVLPSTKEIVEKKVEVISARDLYKKKFPGNGFMWKRLTFKNLVMNHYMNKKDNQNIISIGDAFYEHQATVNLYKEFKNKIRLLKPIKMIQSPNYDEILDQLRVLYNNFNAIYTVKRHLDIALTDKQTFERIADIKYF